MLLKDDYSNFMFENNNSYTYSVNDNYDMIVEVSNMIDINLQEVFDQIIPEHERYLVLKIIDLVRQENMHKVNKTTTPFHDFSK